jgi:formate dehydrogenase major subunit
VPDRPPDDAGTTCPRCGVGCRLAPGADESHARGVAGGANPNGRLCRKGIAAFEGLEDRLTSPLLRREGTLRPVSWTTAYDHVAERFRAILDADGPDALAFLGAPHCTNEENYLLQKVARLLGTNNVDNRARLCHAATARVLADRVGWPATTNGLADLPEADVVLVAGANPAERQPVAFNSFVRPAVDAGTTLVHVDPVGNETTRHADIHVTPRPGTDALVFDLLSARLVADGDGVDRAFVDERTRGFDRFAAALTDIATGETRSAAGVDGATLDRVATRLATADRVAALTGTGIEGGAGGTSAPEALLNLLLLTGSLGRPGTGLFVLRGLVNEQGAADAGCAPDRLPGHQPVTDAAARARIASVWGTEPPASPGGTATDLLASFGDGVRGALVVGENPAVSKRDPDWVRERLDALETLVVVDPVANETTRHADVVLPARIGTEKAGTVTNLERRVQRLHPASEPPDGVRSDRRILQDLGSRLTGRPGEFDHPDAAAVFDELRRVAPTHEGLSYDDLGREGRQWPAAEDGVLYRETFGTPDGRARFGAVQPLVAPESEQGLWLVTGGRTGGSHDDGPAADRGLRIAPADAAERGIDAGETVVVSGADVSLDVPAELDDGVREGAVYLPADVADPLLRREATVVSVRPRSRGTDRGGGV